MVWSRRSRVIIVFEVDWTSYEFLFLIHLTVDWGWPVVIQFKVTSEPMTTLRFHRSSTTWVTVWVPDGWKLVPGVDCVEWRSLPPSHEMLGLGWILAVQIKVTVKLTTALWFVGSSTFWTGWRSEEWQWGNYCCYDSCSFANSLANRLEGRKTRLRSGLRQLKSWKRVLPKGTWQVTNQQLFLIF